MLRFNLLAKIFVGGLFVVASMLPVHSSENSDFDEIFGDIFNDGNYQSYRPKPKHQFNFDYPYYSKRPNGKNTLTALVDLSEQRMKVYINDAFWTEWKVSSGARGYRTPTGRFKPTRMHKMWYSRTYDNTPMPHSIFFYHGYAIHATLNIRGLGRPRSHGCVRLHPKHAKKFFELVKNFGRARTNIVVVK